MTEYNSAVGSAQARELGAELWRVRERAKVSGREIARTLHYDKSTVSRIENGTRTISELDVAMYLVTCGAGEEEFQRLISQARRLQGGPWLRTHGDALPDELRSLSGFMLIDHAEHPSIAYVEAQTASVFTEEPSDIATYRQIVTKLDALALGAEESRKWVAYLATQFERAKDGHGHGRAEMAQEQP